MSRPGRHHRGRCIAALALLATLACCLPCAAASWPPFVPDTLVTLPVAGLPLPTAPRLARDPSTGDLHLAWARGDTIWRAWREGGAWSRELVGGLFLGLLDWAAGPTGRLAIACERYAVLPVLGGVVVVLRRDAGAWSADTVLVHPGWRFTAALAIDGDDRPVLALVAKEQSSATAHLLFARRTATEWVVTELDTSAVGMERPALALDAAGRPRIAYLDGLARPAGAPLRYLEGADPLGDFTETVLDTADSEPSLALNPGSGEPRLAYSRWPQTLYAWRDGDHWGRGPLPFGTEGAHSLSIAPDGSAIVLGTVYTDIVPQFAAEPIPSCGPLFRTGSVRVFQSPTDSRADAFVASWGIRSGLDDRTGPRGAVALGLGHASIAWSNCDESPAAFVASQAGEVSVPPALPPGGVALAPPAPNPARAGERIALSFRLEAPGEVAFALHDVAGRRVAERAAERFDAGPHGVGWAPGTLAPGVYQLVLRVDGRRLTGRTLVVIL